MSKRFQVFISSTYQDLRNQRQLIWQNLINFDYIVAGMETFPAADETQFDFIKKQIDSSDYYILIIGGRYGSTAADGVSYTEKEFNYATEKNIPVLVFPIKDPRKILVEDTDGNSEKAEKLAAFREKACSSRVVKFWSDDSDLILNILQGLQRAAQSHPRPGWVRGDKVANEDTLQELYKLQREHEGLKEQIKSIEDQNFDPKKLGSWTKISFSVRDRTASINLSAMQILKEISATETLNTSFLKQAVEKAISLRTNFPRYELKVSDPQLDHVIFMLTKLQIISIEQHRSRLVISSGPNYFRAMMEVKSSGWIYGNSGQATEPDPSNSPDASG